MAVLFGQKSRFCSKFLAFTDFIRLEPYSFADRFLASPRNHQRSIGMRHYFASTLVAGALLCGVSMSASAAPLTGTSPVDVRSMTEKVHSYHRNCRAGHRHVRRGIVECGPRYYYRTPTPGFSIYVNPRGGRDRHWRGDRNDRRDYRHERRRGGRD